jgi:Ser/Thr protein kinase RdoA (MazF antagonist)
MVATEDLRNALEHALGDHFEVKKRIAQLDRSPCVYGSSYALEELAVELDDGTKLDLMFKQLGESGLSERGRTAKPQFLHDPLREIEVYGSVLVQANLGTARFYGAAVDPARQRYWLFIESVPGVALWQIGEFEIWQEVARWAASLHDRFADDGTATGDHLLAYDADFYRLWIGRALEFADRWEARRPGVARETIERLARGYEEVVERLAALPATFIHGELYASNVLVADEGDAPRVCPIDWEIAALGPGLVDLAALTMGKWNASERAALASAYREARGRPEQLPAPEEFDRTLDCARLHLAVQWLGWAPDWKPPRSQRHDWIEEAAALAENLGL